MSCARFANAKLRTFSSFGSTTGDGWCSQRQPKTIRPIAAAGERGDDARIAPAPGVRLDEAERERGDRQREDHRAEQVGALLGRVLALLEQPRRGDAGRDADGQVDQEHQAPADLDEQAADRRTGRRGDAADRRPDPDREAALVRRELGQQQRERGRHQQRRARGLEHAGGDQQVERRRGAARCRRREEDGQADEEAALAADAVGVAAGRHEQRGEHDRVAVQDPRQRGDAGTVEVGPDVRERDVDDEQVERRQEGGDGDDEKNAVPVSHGGEGVRRKEKEWLRFATAQQPSGRGCILQPSH